MRRIMASLLVLVSTIFSTCAGAQSLPPDIAEIKKTGKLVIAMTSFDNLPFYGGPADNPQGLDVEIGKKVAAILGVKPVFRRDAPTFQDVVEQVRRGEANVAISKLSITPPRLAMVKFSDPYVKLHQGLLINRLWLSQNDHGRAIADVVRNLDGTIGYIRNTAYETFAKINFPHAKYEPRDSWAQVVQDVNTGRIAVAYRDEFEIKKISLEHPESSITTKAVTLTDSTDYIAAVVDYQSDQLLQIVNFVIRNDFANIDVRKLIDMQRQLSGGKK